MADPSEQKGTRETASRLAAHYSEDIKGKVILTTGVSPGGLGAAFVNAIAPMHPAMLILAGLDPLETQKTADHISKASPSVKIRTLQIDLSSLAAVRAAAETVKGWTDVPHIDLLVNNAGISAVPRTVTDEGFEKQLATNYLGPFLFTHIIMSKILASEAPRIVNVGSDGHILSPIRFDDINFRVRCRPIRLIRVLKVSWVERRKKLTAVTL